MVWCRSMDALFSPVSSLQRHRCVRVQDIDLFFLVPEFLLGSLPSSPSYTCVRSSPLVLNLCPSSHHGKGGGSGSLPFSRGPTSVLSLPPHGLDHLSKTWVSFHSSLSPPSFGSMPSPGIVSMVAPEEVEISNRDLEQGKGTVIRCASVVVVLHVSHVDNTTPLRREEVQRHHDATAGVCRKVWHPTGEESKLETTQGRTMERKTRQDDKCSTRQSEAPRKSTGAFPVAWRRRKKRMRIEGTCRSERGSKT